MVGRILGVFSESFWRCEMSEDSDQEKEHAPTQKKLDDARKKGEIPRSQDLTTAGMYAGVLIALVGFGSEIVMKFGGIAMTMIDRPDALSKLIFAESGTSVFKQYFSGLLKSLTPLFLFPGAIVLIVLLSTRSIVFAPEKITPKLSRISMLSNAKNKFGRSGIFEFLKSMSKLLVYSLVLAVFLSHKLPEIIGVLSASPAMAGRMLATLSIQFLSIVFVISLALGGGDYMWQMQEHIRKNRMSMQDMKDEQKSAEGDPHAKQQRRQKGYEIAMNSMMSAIPDADVVIVNPTHYAVVLTWSRDQGSAPTCVAKGVDELAHRIREVANENAIPIHSDPPTSRALFASVEVGQEVPPDLYRAVAAAIRFSEEIRSKSIRIPSA